MKPLNTTTIKMRSNLEVEYAAILNEMKLAGKIVAWYYEPFNIRLADNTYWKPDFLIVYPSHFEFHEVKGFWRRDARAKIKIAANMYPYFRFVGVRKVRGEWQYERFN